MEEALEPLARLVLDICSTALGARFPSGGLTIAGFEALIEARRDTLQLGVLRDDSPLRPEQSLADLDEQSVRWLETTYEGRLNSVGRQHGFRGYGESNDLLEREGLNSVVSVVRDADEQRILFTRSPVPLTYTDGIDRVEALLVEKLENPQMPRSRFVL